jgi:hypothetical protein
MSIHHLEELSSGSRDSIFLHIRWNYARLVIQLERSHSHSAAHPIENSFIERYNAACDSDDFEEAEALSDEILHAVVETGRPIFDRIAPPPTSSSHDLHTLLFPKEYTFHYRTLNGEAELVEHGMHTNGDVSRSILDHFQLKADESCHLPRYSTRDIRVLENLAYNGYIARVEVNGQEMCSKAGDTKGENAAQRELDCLWKITTGSPCDDSTRAKASRLDSSTRWQKSCWIS